MIDELAYCDLRVGISDSDKGNMRARLLILEIRRIREGNSLETKCVRSMYWLCFGKLSNLCLSL